MKFECIIVGFDDFGICVQVMENQHFGKNGGIKWRPTYLQKSIICKNCFEILGNGYWNMYMQQGL